MAGETNITLEASLSFGMMEEKVSLILEKPEICHEPKVNNMNLTLYRKGKPENHCKSKMGSLENFFC